MEITPEIISTKIFKAEPYEDWNNGELGFKGWRLEIEDDSLRWHPELPTFKESEWTGPLLEKAASICDHYDLGRSGDEYSMVLWKNSDDGSDAPDMISAANSVGSPNLAIAEAILEAEGK